MESMALLRYKIIKVFQVVKTVSGKNETFYNFIRCTFENYKRCTAEKLPKEPLTVPSIVRRAQYDNLTISG